MAYGAGRLDRIVRVERIVDGTDAVGGPTAAWSLFCERWGSRRDVSDGERHAAGETGGHVLTRFVLRDDPDTRLITAKDRLIVDGLTFDIVGIKEAGTGRGRYIEFTAAARTDGQSH